MQGEYHIVVTLKGQKFVLGKNKEIYKIDETTREFSNKETLSRYIIDTFHPEFKKDDPNAIFDTIEIRYPDPKGKPLDIAYSEDVIDEEKIKNDYFYYLLQNVQARKELAFKLCRGLQLAIGKKVDFIPVSEHETRCYNVYHDETKSSTELRRELRTLIRTYLTSYRRYRDIYFLLKNEGELVEVKDIRELNSLLESLIKDNVPLEEIDKLLQWNLTEREHLELSNLTTASLPNAVKAIIEARGSGKYVSSGLHSYITLILMKEQKKSR